MNVYISEVSTNDARIRQVEAYHVGDTDDGRHVVQIGKLITVAKHVVGTRYGDPSLAQRVTTAYHDAAPDGKDNIQSIANSLGILIGAEE